MYIVGGERIFVVKKLVEAAQEALYVGIRTVKPDIRLNEIGKAVRKIYGKPDFQRCAWILRDTALVRNFTANLKYCIITPMMAAWFF